MFSVTATAAAPGNGGTWPCIGWSSQAAAGGSCFSQRTEVKEMEPWGSLAGSGSVMTVSALPVTKSFKSLSLSGSGLCAWSLHGAEVAVEETESGVMVASGGSCCSKGETQQLEL